MSNAADLTRRRRRCRGDEGRDFPNAGSRRRWENGHDPRVSRGRRSNAPHRRCHVSCGSCFPIGGACGKAGRLSDSCGAATRTRAKSLSQCLRGTCPRLLWRGRGCERKLDDGSQEARDAERAIRGAASPMGRLRVDPSSTEILRAAAGDEEAGSRVHLGRGCDSEFPPRLSKGREWARRSLSLSDRVTGSTERSLLVGTVFVLHT